jgi:hypothetical protein
MDPGNCKRPFCYLARLTIELVKKHLPKSMAMVKGHFNQQRRNIGSMQSKLTLEDTAANISPTPDNPNDSH